MDREDERPLAAPKERDPDPRGPDAPHKDRQHEVRGPQLVEHLGETPELSTGKAKRHFRAALATVAPPAIVPQFTDYNYDPGRSGVSGIVLHTIVGTLGSAWARFSQPNQASAHYGVSYYGTVVRQWVVESNTAWHCGRYYPDATHMANRNSIGIEHEDMGLYNSPRPAGLYETSARLVAWICDRYGLPIDHSTVRGQCAHREVSVVGTACPDSLDVERIINLAKELSQGGNMLDEKSPSYQALIWRQHAVINNLDTVQDGPTKGEKNMLKAELDSLKAQMGAAQVPAGTKLTVTVD